MAMEYIPKGGNGLQILPHKILSQFGGGAINTQPTQVALTVLNLYILLL